VCLLSLTAGAPLSPPGPVSSSVRSHIGGGQCRRSSSDGG